MDLNKIILNKVCNIMVWQEMKWFFCFGTLLEFVRSNKQTFCIDKDIDIGVIYGKCDAEQLIKAFRGSGYDVTQIINNDVTGKPLNIHFSPPDETPTVDIYFWIKKDGFYWHTYDVDNERKKIPSKYTFKGIKAEWIEVPKETIKRIHEKNPEGRLLINNFGVWTYDMFVDHGDTKFFLPYSYGTLLDEWYPGWLIPNKHFGQSRSRFVKKVKSCKEL